MRRVLKKKNIALMIIVAGILFLVVILNIPLKTYVDKSLNCIDTNSQDTIIVTISGTMYSYLLKDDLFIGTIEVQGKRLNTGTFELRNDMYTNLTDNYGQPMEMVLQFDNFSYVNIAGTDYSISSEWNPEWNEKFQRQKKINKFLNHIFKE